MNGLKGLEAYHQFLLSHIYTDTDGKLKKQPVNAHGKPVSFKDSSHWLSHAEAHAAVAALGNAYRVSFVLSEQDPFWCVDIDDCFDPQTNSWSPEARELCQRLQGAAIEVSNSMRGLHIIGSGSVPEHRIKYRSSTLKAELYTSNKPITLTYLNVIGDACCDLTAAISSVAEEFFPPREEREADWTTAPRSDWDGHEDDEELLSHALRSESGAAAFGQRASFKQLFTNDEALVDFYHGDKSAMDMALAVHLAFWTGCNCERMQRLMLRSELVRDKWDEDIHATYLHDTILCAAAQQSNVHKKRSVTVAVDAPIVRTTLARLAPVSKSGSRILLAEAQQELFKGCVYIRDIHAALVPDGDVLTPEQFRVTYGGYEFAVDAHHQKRPITDAWKAFTESPLVPNKQAHALCFRPDLAPGDIIVKFGRLLANQYVAQQIPRKAGDASPFLTHLAKLLPNETDRAYLLNYMAHVVQRQGHRIRWCPLIQGTQGNGKSLLNSCLENAIGHQYSFHATPASLYKEFNKFLSSKTFVYVEDMHVPHELDGAQYMEMLKSMVTDNRLAIRAMRTDHQMQDIVCNFMFTTNSLDALPKIRNDRRFAMFYTAQQSYDDLMRDGMDDEYFSNLAHWLNAEDGFAIVSEFLWTYPLTPLPSRAAITSSTELAIEVSKSPFAQDIIEAIEEGRHGFKTPYVSSTALDELIDAHYRSTPISRIKRREVMKELGYDWHPALPKGRATKLVPPRNVRPCIYVLMSSEAAKMRESDKVVEHYIAVQDAR